MTFSHISALFYSHGFLVDVVLVVTVVVVEGDVIEGGRVQVFCRLVMLAFT